MCINRPQSIALRPVFSNLIRQVLFMPASLIPTFLVYCFVNSITPGPANLCTLSAALRYGREYGFLMTSGSDNHNAEMALAHPERVTGVALEKKLTSIQDWVQHILTRQPISLCVPDSRFDIPADAPRLNTFWMDEKEDLVPTGRDWLHE